MQAGIFTYPWDLEAEGYDNALQRIAGNGFNAVNLACAYHAGKFLLPHNPRHRVYFPEDGAIYFRPDTSRYGRIKPLVSNLVDLHSDPLRSLDDQRRKHGVELVAWTVCLHNTWIGSNFPDCAMHTAFGDPLVHSLSPAHPDVREYIVALVTDIVTIADVAAIQLESPEYMGYDHGYHHEVTPVPIGDPDIQRRLLSLSFNPIEIERAGGEGIDAERLRSQVAEALDTHWNYPDRRVAAMDRLMSNSDYRSYVDSLQWLEAEFLTEVRSAIKAVKPDVEVRLFAGMAPTDKIGSLPSHVLENADGFLSGYVSSDDAARERTAQLRSQSQGKPVFGMVRAIMPDVATPDQAAQRVAAWRDAGVDGIDVYNYGFMTLPALDAVGAALR